MKGVTAASRFWNYAAIALLVCSSYPVLAATGDAVDCGSCHISSEPGDPISALHASPHWQSSTPGTPVNGEGCIACHGDSAAHADAPTTFQPDVSFGPRWTSTVDAQNQVCLACHDGDGGDGGKYWKSGLHARQDLTCSSCHDSHTAADPVTTAANQSQVCGVCHKVQKEGIHDLPELLSENPPCSSCHNAHGDPHPASVMLANRSEGCRACHDLQQMMAAPTATPRANNYHKVMASAERTCIDCHRGVAHVDADNFAAVVAGGFESMQIDLFYPGQTDNETLLSEHRGAQALRQGRSCRQCHLGEGRMLGEALAPAGTSPSLPVDVSFRQDSGYLDLTISFSGNASSIAVMFDDGSVDDFNRDGCWAACHSDLPGMSQDRGLQPGKYLRASRTQTRSIGRPPIIADAATLAQMRAAGFYVELWQVSLDAPETGALSVFEILEVPHPVADSPVMAEAEREGSSWTVTFRRPLQDPQKPLIPGRVYSFGIAIHGDGASGAQHWVSLPMTVSLGGADTDFIAGQ